MLNLQQIWQSLAFKYCSNQEIVSRLWQEIAKCYSTPSRYYHNLHHLEFILKAAQDYESEITDFDTLLFSIFFHDIVYNSSRSDNEEKSSELAAKRLSELSVPGEKIQKCRQQILATKTHSSNDDTDTNFLLDFDLLILGQNWETYKEYAQNVRKEYSIYPDLLYNNGRRKILQSFLEKDRIFKTQEIHQKHEQQARENLQQELETL